jgi:hypothetical protein
METDDTNTDKFKEWVSFLAYLSNFPILGTLRQDSNNNSISTQIKNLVRNTFNNTITASETTINNDKNNSIASEHANNTKTLVVIKDTNEDIKEELYPNGDMGFFLEKMIQMKFLYFDGSSWSIIRK